MLITLSIMNPLLRFLASASLFASICTAFAVGCASPDAADDDAASSASDLTGTLAQARGCAIRNAYVAADVSDFHVLPNADALPYREYISDDTSSTYATLDVPGVGTVYYVERTTFFTVGTSVMGEFHDAQGTLLAGANPNTMQFWSASGAMLSCSGSLPSSAADASMPVPHPSATPSGPISPPHISDASHD